jgi:hypothetical protein
MRFSAHPYRDHEFPAWLAALGFTDTSDAMDSAPTCARTLERWPNPGPWELVVWVDHPDPARRSAGTRRYQVQLNYGEDRATWILLAGFDDDEAARVFLTTILQGVQ